MVNRFILNETSYHGAGAINNIAEEVKRRGFSKAFICSDPDLLKFGVTQKVLKVLEDNNLEYEIYSNIKPNPTIENVQGGVEAYKTSNSDYIIAIGGGSSMDTAKAIGIIINNPEFNDVRSLEGVAPTKYPSVPIIAVPTTSGTAAEVTINYVITDVEKNRKMVCVDPHDIPVVAIIDPEMMESMPKGLTAATGMDALTHAVEVCVGRSMTKASKGAAQEAVKLIFENLEKAYTNGSDLEARKNMLHASYLAGTAFTKSYVGYVHAVAHTLGGKYGVAHGLANAILLPHILRAYGESVYASLAELAIIVGLADKETPIAEAAEIIISHIEQMNEKMGIPKKLGCIRREDIPAMAKLADKEANPLYPVPILFDAMELESLYLLVYDEANDEKI